MPTHAKVLALPVQKVPEVETILQEFPPGTAPSCRIISQYSIFHGIAPPDAYE